MKNSARRGAFFSGIPLFYYIFQILSLREQIEINDAASLWKATIGYYRVRRRVMGQIFLFCRFAYFQRDILPGIILIIRKFCNFAVTK